ncbi:MAG TPA: hypothetical protein VGJ77_08570 [Gaiellaceae bacterium]
MPRPSRVHVFAGGVAVCAAVAATYAFAASRSPELAPAAPPAPAAPAPAAPRPVVAAKPTGVAVLLGAKDLRGRQLLFRDLDRSNTANFGRIAIAPVTNPAARRLVGTVRCERVYFAGGRGLCLAKGGGFGTLYSAQVLDAQYRVVHKIPLAGLPSRARVSPDGRYGATTTFVTGHSYNSPGKFSTQTLLLDLVNGKVIANLEKFTVTRGGARVDRPDVNFWGVTYARNSNRFYATMATGDKTYLIEGDVAARTARVLRENVECPSLSPDGTRIAYKKRVVYAAGSPRIWNLHVLDLRTLRDTALAETLPIDDQAEWLGNRLVLYRNSEEIRVVPADGSGAPMSLLPGADSPATLVS